MNEAKRHKKQLFFFPVHQHLAIYELYFCTHRKNSCLPNKRGGYKSIVASKTVFGTSVPIFSVFAKILGAFAKLRKMTVSFVVSVRPPIHSSVLPSKHSSVRPSLLLSAWNNSTPTGRISKKFDTCVFSKNFRENSSFIKLKQE